MVTFVQEKTAEMEIFWRSPIKSLMFDVRVFYFLSYSLQLWSLSLYFPSPSPSILSLTLLLLLAKGGHNISPKEGPFNNYVDQIYPTLTTYPLEWTIFDIYSTYYLFTWPELSADHLPTSSCPRSYWMAPRRVYFLARRKLGNNLRDCGWVHFEPDCRHMKK